MSEKKELNIEELEKVSGGDGEKTQSVTLRIYYYETPTSTEEKYADVTFTSIGMRNVMQDKEDAENWCNDNGYRYSRYEMTGLNNVGL